MIYKMYTYVIFLLLKFAEKRLILFVSLYGLNILIVERTNALLKKTSVGTQKNTTFTFESLYPNYNFYDDKLRKSNVNCMCLNELI